MSRRKPNIDTTIEILSGGRIIVTDENRDMISDAFRHATTIPIIIMGNLTETERAVITMRIKLAAEKSKRMKEIADEFSLTDEEIEQITQEALSKFGEHREFFEDMIS